MEIRTYERDEYIDSLVEEIYGRSPIFKQKADWVQVAREVYKAQQYRKRYEELEKTLLAELVQLSHNKEAYGGGFKLEQINRKGSVDYKSIPLLKDLDLEPYRKESSSYWKLSTALTEAIDSMGIL